jgi:hypothetical protein
VVLTSFFYSFPSLAGDKNVCEEIAHEVEISNKLPKNILASISLVESGRKDEAGLVKPWPWSLNHAGKSVFFASKAETLQYLKKNITPNFKNIDVGCMQVNVRWHRENFDTLDSMIDPRKNIEYAALFLSTLKSDHGSWEQAIKHYHSSTPKLNVKYYAKVKQVWKKKTDSNSLIQKAMLSLDEAIVFPRTKSLRLDYRNFDPYENSAIIEDVNYANDIAKDVDQSSELNKREIKNTQSPYVNAVLIETNKKDDREEFKRYIKHRSAYLGKKIDMILLFRKEFSKN